MTSRFTCSHFYEKKNDIWRMKKLIWNTNLISVTAIYITNLRPNKGFCFATNFVSSIFLCFKSTLNNKTELNPVYFLSSTLEWTVRMWVSAQKGQSVLKRRALSRMFNFLKRKLILPYKFIFMWVAPLDFDGVKVSMIHIHIHFNL